MDFAQLTQSAIDGEVSSLEAYVILKRNEKAIKAAIEAVQPLAIEEADKWSEKTFKFQGATIEKKERASTWDYSNVIAYQQAKERLKYIEKVAQAGGGADIEGEVIEPAQKIDGKSTISVKL